MGQAEIRIDLDAKCKRCGKSGATQNGLCLDCINKAIKQGELDHILKPLRERLKRRQR